MKYEGKNQEQEQGNSDQSGTEYDKDGNAMKGGGFYKEGGKLMKKSDDALTGDDLQKSLDKLGEFAKSEDTPSRKEELLAQASTGVLSKSENDELFGLLGGGEVATPKVADDLTKSLTDNDALQNGLDVSSYLQENHDALVKSLGCVGDAIEQSDTRRHAFAMLQAKALVDIGGMVKSMSEVLGVLTAQPVTGPKSAGINGSSPLNKSFGNDPGGGEERLSKSDVLNALDGLMNESMEKSQGGRLGNGADISVATAKYEAGNQISPYVLDQVKRWRTENAASR